MPPDAPAIAPTSAPAASPSPASAPSTKTSTPSTSSAPTQSMTSDSFRAAILSGGGKNPFAAPEVAEAPDDSGDFELDSDNLPGTEDDSEEAPADELGDEPTSEEDDYSWASELKDFKDGLHGVKLQDLLKALQSGQVPEALLDKLMFDLKDGDRTWKASAKEMRDSAMLRSNYTRKLQEVAQERTTFQTERGKHQQEIKDFADYVNSWKSDESGGQLLAAMERMGMPFDKAARAYAVRLAELENVQALEAEGKLPQGTAERLQRAQQNEVALAQEKSERSRLARAQEERAAQEQNQNSSAQRAQVVTAVKNESAKIFEEVGVKMSEGSWNIYKQHLSAIWDVNGEAPTRQQLRDAVIATKEDVDLYLSQHQNAPAQTKAAPQAVSRSLDGGAPKVKAPNPNKSVTSKEYERMLRAGQNPFAKKR